MVSSGANIRRGKNHADCSFTQCNTKNCNEGEFLEPEPCTWHLLENMRWRWGFGDKYPSVEEAKAVCNITPECAGITCENENGECQMSLDDIKGSRDKGWTSYECGPPLSSS